MVGFGQKGPEVMSSNVEVGMDVMTSVFEELGCQYVSEFAKAGQGSAFTTESGEYAYLRKEESGYKLIGGDVEVFVTEQQALDRDNFKEVAVNFLSNI